ncbi:hypothetical protein P9990_26610 (plasmid) [Prescottella equi]|uniref:hypothetical protein n=1 Tax=Rhodococcus hoagii TaxID=43767 RepID=UPI002575D2CF|nr:hypothetical protein [Prescottella equi]WJJ14385.1 hypothetical protein P9990_26610 [Prescottella equi]
MAARVLPFLSSTGLLPESPHRLRYCDVERAIRYLTAHADADQQRSLAVFAVRRLTRLDGLSAAAESGLLPPAARAFRSACVDPVDVEAGTLGRWVSECESSLVYGDDETSESLTAALCGLACWHRYLQGDTTSALDALAFTLLDVTGFDMHRATFDTGAVINPELIEQLRIISGLLARHEPLDSDAAAPRRPPLAAAANTSFIAGLPSALLQVVPGVHSKQHGIRQKRRAADGGADPGTLPADEPTHRFRPREQSG